MAKKIRSTLTIDLNEPTRLHQSSYRLISLDPLVAVMEFGTDAGMIPIGVNRAMAEQLLEVLRMLLAEKAEIGVGATCVQA